ncbi:MAG: hypothetical protein Q9199_007356 [Rusavskia elegans]
MYYDPLTGEYYEDPSDEDDYYGYDYGYTMPAGRTDYENALPACYADGAPLSPPTVCHSGCRNLSHRIPSGGLPEGASLGGCHQVALEEHICLTHVAGGCFDGGICERLNQRITMETIAHIGYPASSTAALSRRQRVRVAAGLPAGPADPLPSPPPGMHAAQGVRERRGGHHEQWGYGQERGSAAPGSREGAPLRRPRGPDAFEDGPVMRRGRGEGGLRGGPREPSGGFVLPDEVEEDDMMEGNGPVDLGGRPHGSRRHEAARAGGTSRRVRGPEGGHRGMGGPSCGYGQGSGERDMVPRDYDFEGQGRRR